jgi:hypothetical protein
VKAYADIPSEFEQKAKLVLRSKQVLGQVYCKLECERYLSYMTKKMAK